MIDVNQLMQMASLMSALGGGVQGGQPAVPSTGGATTPQMPVQGAGMQAGAVPQQSGGQMPVPGVSGGLPAPQTGMPVPMQGGMPMAQQNPPQMPKTGFDRMAEWLSGGMTGESPEAIADRENFRRMNTIMALGTSLGGAIAGGPGASVVGDVSASLNNMAQGNIMASNAAEKETAMNELMNKQLSAITGGGANAGAAQQVGANPAVMPGATAATKPTMQPSALASTPVSAPESGNAGTLTVADLEQRLSKLFG